MLAAPDLFDLTHFAHRSLFAGTTFAWEVLPHLEAYIRDQFATRLRPAVQTMLPPGAFIAGDVFIGTETVVEPGAPIHSPTIIGRACQIRQGAYIRGNVIVGDGCVVGHATEVKQSVLLNHARATFRLHLSTRIYALNWYRTDNVQPVACDLLAERRICDLVDARAEEAYAPPNQAAICWQAGKQEQGSQN